jgi:hypothetical protein
MWTQQISKQPCPFAFTVGYGLNGGQGLAIPWLWESGCLFSNPDVFEKAERGNERVAVTGQQAIITGVELQASWEQAAGLSRVGTVWWVG